MQLRPRTGTALTLACLLAISALAQTPHASTNRPQTDPTVNGQDASPEMEAPAPWDDGSYDFADGYEDGHVQTDLDALDLAHENYVKRSDLQLKRPEWEAPPPEPRKPPSRWQVAITQFLNALSPLFQFLFYALVVAVLGGIAYFIFGEAIRARFGWSKKGKVAADDDILIDLRPDAAKARSLLEEADKLARAGKFAEAVHLLLFRSIEDIQARLEGGVPSSLTAREIGNLQRLPERARRGLGPIITLVERSFFGGSEVDAEGWRQARSSYQDFAFGEGWS